MTIRRGLPGRLPVWGGWKGAIMVLSDRLLKTVGIIGASAMLAACGGTATPAPSAPVLSSPVASTASARADASGRVQFEAKDKVEKPPAESKAPPTGAAGNTSPSGTASEGPQTAQPAASAAQAIPPASQGARTQASATLVLSPDGTTVYDTVNNVTWLADANLAASNRFGLPVCNGSDPQPTCVNASGSMSYQAAAAWVAAMNAANYLGHNNWQLPTTPSTDKTCPFTGPNGDSFGFNCSAQRAGFAVLQCIGPEGAQYRRSHPQQHGRSIQQFPALSLLVANEAPAGAGYATFSFNTGFQGSNTTPNFLYVLPMIRGKIPGTPPATGNGLQVNPGGQTVYDPVTNVTWLANANLAATNTFGLPRLQGSGQPENMRQPGRRDELGFGQPIRHEHEHRNGAGYLGQKNWQLPPIDPNCPAY